MAVWPVIDLDTAGQPNFVLLISPCDGQTLALEGIGNELKSSEQGLRQFSLFFPRSVTETLQSESSK